ncbi:hypothetical protein BN946_scf184781.g1 [Trametes cinnabarina]|uniref:F-box domain-containing protein n=1 Tax=Pycnoporus cinnabarinus TaxID=5643 RepID=A0A060SW35_PYCCI|nr:hypothetical protein BN946_scf184781.g1 [Trametes cinnabarina]
MTGMSKLPQDVVHEILVALSDFSTLAAAIRTCKSFYDAFQVHSKLVTHAVLRKASGPALLHAKRLDHFICIVVESPNMALPRNLPADEFFESDAWKLTRDVAMRMESRGGDVQILEDTFSLRHKDRTSLISKLDVIERLRFHRAVYRYWICHEILKHDMLREPGEDDEEDEDGNDVDGNVDPVVLGGSTSDELFELIEICTFLKAMEVWQCRTTSTSPAPYVPFWTSVDPGQLAQSLETRQTCTDYDNGVGYHDVISLAARKLLHALAIPNDRIAQAYPKTILDAVCGADSRCSRCQVVHGNELYGQTNMHLLAGMLVAADEGSLLPGLLPRNRYELQLLYNHLLQNGPPISSDVVVGEMIAMDTDGAGADEETWSFDDWYCLDCIRELYRQRFMRWWREKKQKNGAPTQDDCWYGYNCRTMTHKTSHAAKLNHLCKPTRGDAPNIAPAHVAAAASLSYRDALSLSHTCKAARALPLEPALHTIVLDRSTKQLITFKDFLLAMPSRPLFLRSLVITKNVTWDMDDLLDKVASAVADILERALKLEQFNCGSIRELSNADPRIGTSLVSLQKLTHLTLLDGGLETSITATTLKSPRIEQLTIDMLSRGNRLTFVSFYGKIARYSRLQSLSISKMYDTITIPVPPQTDIVIPSLRTLALHSTYIPLSLASTMFPNVTNITFTNARHFPSVHRPELDPAEVATCWPTLQEAHIDARDLALWPIASRVRWLDLDVLRGGDSHQAIHAVNRTDPRVLSCAYTTEAANLFWKRLPLIALSLRFLDLKLLELSSYPRGCIQERVLKHLSRFHALTALFLCVRAFHQPNDLDAEIISIAKGLGRRNAKLQFVGVSFTDGRTMREDHPVWEEELQSSRWFFVRRSDECDLASLQDLPTNMGLSVRNYMYKADYDAPDWAKRLPTIA